MSNVGVSDTDDSNTPVTLPSKLGTISEPVGMCHTVS